MNYRNVVKALCLCLGKETEPDSPPVADFPQLDEQELNALYGLSRLHDVAHLVAAAIADNRLIDGHPDILKKFERERFKAYYRVENLEGELDRVGSVLKERGIRYVPLKGSVIRDMYDEAWKRTSCDIDVLVSPDDLDEAVAALVAAGYETDGKRNFHDVSFRSAGDVHLELHFCVLEDDEKLDPVLGEAFDHIIPDDGYRCKFTDEFFMFYFYAHTAHHLLNGGCGVRPFLDLYRLKKFVMPEAARLNSLLERAGLVRFAFYAGKLSDYFVTGKVYDDFTGRLAAYVLSGGAYGTERTSVAAGTEKHGGSVGYTFRLLFPKYGTMCVIYPVLKRHPYLLPGAYVLRGLSKLLGGRGGDAVRRIKSSSAVSEENIAEIKRIRSGLGL